jgi:hypothetical protein
MAHDASLYSEIEAWAVATILAIRIGEDAPFPAGQVIHYPGLASWDGSLSQVMEEFANKVNRRPFCTVGWSSSTALQKPTEDSADRESTYMIHLVEDNMRLAAARLGETGTPVIPGTHRLMELIHNALDDKTPAKTAASPIVRTSQQTEVRAMRSIPCPAGVSVIEIELVVREVPSAGA